MTQALFDFDRPYRLQYGCIAGVDEAGRGPLAGPVVAAAVILPDSCILPFLNDSKQLTAGRRQALFSLIQAAAVAFGVGVVDAGTIDRVNIRQASFLAMRKALGALRVSPAHVLVDGFAIPDGPVSQSAIIKGDALSAHIAAASVLAKVTRDAMMEDLDRQYPRYGFARHKGYGTSHHLAALRRWGPSPVHRRSFAPVAQAMPAKTRAVKNQTVKTA